MSFSLSFLGAAQTVTGSRYLLEFDGKRILIDCGLFQGLKHLRLRNWASFPLPTHEIDTVVLTHAHLDHSGYLPALVRDGFRGRIHCSAATRDLCDILLLDSAHLLEKDAEFANRHGYSKHHPALPLYTIGDAENALKRFSAVPFEKELKLANGLSIRFMRAGHILGAAIVIVEWGGRKIVFSGDLGRFGDPTMVDPEIVAEADYLVVESTYGDRRHDARDPQQALAEVIETTIARGGTVVIPAFAVGRAQSILYHLSRLKASGRLANVPVFLDSPMAVDASDILCRHNEDQRLSAEQCKAACQVAVYVRDVEISKRLDADRVPKVIVSASGMATGGRVLHHIEHFAPDPRNTILFAGFQAAGTRGASMVGGAEAVKIHGQYIPIRAQIENLSMMSAHADADEILKWLQGFQRSPRMTFITHGEPEASDALRRRIQDELRWRCKVPEHLERQELA